MSNWKRNLRGLAIGVGVVFGACVILLLAAYGLLQTEVGRAQLARLLARHLSRPGEMEIRIARLAGTPPQRVELFGVSVRDAEGEWLRLASAVVEWHPRELFRRRLHVMRLDVSGLHLSRFPARPDGGQQPVQPWWPRLPFAVAVDRFSFEDVRLGSALIGVEASFRGAGESTTGGDGILRTTMTLERTDGPPGRAEAHVTFHPQTDRLTLRVEMGEPKGGVIARLLDLSGLPAVAVALDGDGPLTAWRGRLIAHAGDLASLVADLRVRRAEATVVQIQGQADVARLFAEPVRGLLSKRTSFDLELRFADEASLVLRQGRVASDAGTLDLDGRFERGQVDLKTDLRLTRRGMEAVNRLWAPMAAEGLTVTGTVAGAALQPTIRLEVAVAGPSVPEASARVLRGVLSWNPERSRGAGRPTTRIAGQGRIEGLRLGVRAVATLIGDSVEWAMQGRVDPDDRGLILEEFLVSTAFARLRGSGDFSLAGQGGHAVLAVEVDDLATVGRAIGRPIRGGARLEAHLQSAGFASGLRAAVTGDIHGFGIGDSTADVLWGSRLTVAAAVSTVADGTLTVKDLTVRGEAVTLEAAATLAGRPHRIDGRYQLRVKDLERLSNVLGIPIGGSLAVHGVARGRLGNPALHGSLSITGSRVRGVAVGSVAGTFAVDKVATAPGGRLSLTLPDLPFGPVEAASNFALVGRSRLRLDDLSVATREATVQGAAVVPLTGGPGEGRLSGRIASLNAWSHPLGRPVSGAASFGLTWRPDGPRQAAELRIEGSRVAVGVHPVGNVAAGRVALSVRLNGLPQSPNGRFTLEAVDAHFGGAQLTNFSLSGDTVGIARVENIRVQAAGDFRGPFRITGAGGMAREDGVFRGMLDRLEVRIVGRTVTLQQPLAITYGPTRFDTDPVRLAVDDGRIGAQWHSDGERVSGTLEWTGVPLSLARAVWPGTALGGTIAGHARIEGPSDAPSGRIDISLAEVGLATQSADDLGPLSGTIQGTWGGGRLKMKGEMAGLPQTKLVIQADVPLRIAATSRLVTMPDSERVMGHVTYRGELAPLWELFPLGEDRVKGRADLALEVQGTVGAPHLNGALSVTQGEYENRYTGLVVKDVALSCRVDRDRIEVTRAVGTDVDAGRLSVSGSLTLDPRQGYPVHLALEVDNALLVRRDEMTASATGRITLEGTLARALLRGHLQTERIEARMLGRLPREVVRLDVVEINRPEASSDDSRPVPPRKGESSIRLDLTVTMPRQVFIRGRGLDSEWAGTLHVTGTTRAPIIEGVLKPIRGQFSFAGKAFKLAEGSVTFEGGERIDPVLNLSAEHSTPDLTASIRLTGPASRPEISLTSQPPLPPSEVASRVLFGKARGQLNPVEAVQLAEAISSLSGGGSGGILDFARRTLGVDILRVKGSADAGEGPEVTLGKYVTERVYVGATQGTASGTGSATVEVEVTPNITLESNMGQDGRSNIGVKWKWDY